MPHRFARADGFTLTELLVSTTIMLLVVGATMTTFKHASDINDSATGMADANLNLRAGTNQLTTDLMMAGRIISNGGIPVPNGTGATAISRPGPPGANLTFALAADEDGTLMLPAITSGNQLGPTINGSTTDIVTILTVDEFMTVLQGIGSGTPTNSQALINADGSSLTLPQTSPWLVGDPTSGSGPIAVGELVLFKNANGMALETVTSVDATHINFAANSTNDWFHLNQRSAAYNGTIYCIKAVSACDALPVSSTVQSAAWTSAAPAIMRVLMITYYVDPGNTTTPPRLTRVIDHFTPQALAGVVEDLDLTFDLVDTTSDSVQAVPSLPYTVNGLTYTSNMIKKVNVHLGVRSEAMSKTLNDYVRNHITTSVGVRSLASVDRYDTGQ